MQSRLIAQTIARAEDAIDAAFAGAALRSEFALRTSMLYAMADLCRARMAIADAKQNLVCGCTRMSVGMVRSAVRWLRSASYMVAP